MSATISDCGKYRYVLHRSLESIVRWHHPCLFIMLNPSTADAEKDDPTIRKCKTLATNLSCTHLTVVNLFAYRATDPKELFEVDDPIGPQNAGFLSLQIDKHRHGKIIVGWGNNPLAVKEANKILPLAKFHCFGTNKNGSPKHPLYISNLSELQEFN